MLNLVLVEWVDSVLPLAGWRWLSDPPEMEIIRCVSVGWLIAETDEVVMLAPNLGDRDSESAQASGHIRIPKQAITRRALLVEDK